MTNKIKSPAEMQGRKFTTSLKNNSTLTNIDFITHAFVGIEANEVPWVTGFNGDVAAQERGVWFGSPAIPLPRLIRDTGNNYVSISTFGAGEDGRPRRRLDCWSGMWLVLLDDIGTKIDRKKALRLPPSCLVETSPGNFQGWLFLNEPLRDREKAEALINGLIAAGASDPGAGGLPRYGRLPVGQNGKPKYHDSNGKDWVQRVHEWHPERRYSVEQIAEAYKLDLTPKPKPRAAQKRTAPTHEADAYINLLDWADMYIGAVRAKSGAHHIVCPWFKQHTGEDTTGTVYFEPDEPNDMRGGFKCQHGHCAKRNIDDFDHFMRGLIALRKQKEAA